MTDTELVKRLDNRSLEMAREIENIFAQGSRGGVAQRMARVQVLIRDSITFLEGENKRLKEALEDIALLDEADGHQLTLDDAFRAVAIATKTLDQHPSEIFARRARKEIGE